MMMFLKSNKLIFLTVITMMIPSIYIFNLLLEERAAGREQLLLTKELLKQSKLINLFANSKHKDKKNINENNAHQTDRVNEMAEKFAKKQEKKQEKKAKKKAKKRATKKTNKKTKNKTKNKGDDTGNAGEKEKDAQFQIHEGKYIPGIENAIILDEASRRRSKNRKQKKKKKKEEEEVDDNVEVVGLGTTTSTKEKKEEIKEADKKKLAEPEKSVVSYVDLSVPPPESYIYKPAEAPKQRTLNKYIAKKCREMGLEGKMPLPAVPLYNEKHKLLYIANPKCGSTSFKKFMRRLAGDTLPYDEMKDVHKEDVNIIKNLYNESREVQEMVFRDYYKVTFVRNPLVRLVSGYRNKIIRAQYTTMIQRIITKHYGPEAARSWLPRHKYRPSFEQFVDHILTTEDINNSHWTPYADKIQLCGFKYDMIGQLETASQQIDFLKKNLNTLEGIEFPPSRTESHQDGYSSEQLTFVAYANLTKLQLKSIYELYKNEIKLLGYSTLTDGHFPYIKLAKIIDNNVHTGGEIQSVLPNDQELLPGGHDDDADHELIPDVQLQNPNSPPMDDDGPMPMD